VKLVAAFTALLSLWIAFAQVNQPTPRVGDGGPATRAEINDPYAIAVDGSKTLYIAETDVIRCVDLKSGVISTLRIGMRLEAIAGLAVDAAGNLLATEFTVDRVRRIDPRSGLVTTIAGNKSFEFSGDRGPAINAGLSQPYFATADAANNIYIADMGNSRIRRVDATTGIITTVAGNGKRDSSGDGGSALDAGLEYPNSVALDRDSNLFIAQYGYGQDSHRIRRVDAKTGIITTVAGSAKAGLTGDGGPALAAGLVSPSDLLFDHLGNLYVVDPVNDRVRYIDAKTQSVRTIAGSIKGFGGDGGPAVRARLDNPCSIAMDSEGNLFIAEFVNHRVRRVDARTGVIQTVAGNGLPNHLHVQL
jgi:sugar lactone lactonase YvrE